jgi:hypothetical protein
MGGTSRTAGWRGPLFGFAAGVVVVGSLGLLGPRVQPLGAQTTPPAEGSTATTIAFTTNSPDAGQHLYIVDTRTQSFAVYRINPRDPKGAVKLEGARQYRWDLKLAEFNNQEPEVATIESMVASPRK